MPKFKFQDTSLTVDERVSALLEELTAEEKTGLITFKQKEIPRLGIKGFRMGTEGARGVVIRSDRWDETPYPEMPATVFPEPFGLAASFDTELMNEIGNVTGTETRIYNKMGKASLFLWAPTVDLERDPRWGRNEEGYGEDPCLTGRMTAALTKGMVGTDEKYLRVIPTLKHFYANNHENDRTCDSAYVPETLKRDYYMKAFEYPIKNGGAKAIMTAYSSINGVEALCSPELTEICKKEWGMLFSMTDAYDFVENVTRHRTDKTHAETIAKIYKNGGVDIITDEPDAAEAALKEAMEKGLVDEKDLDRVLFGPLKARFLLGEFDSGCPYDKVPKELLMCEEHTKTALRAAEESIVLLRNRRLTLPLKQSDKIAVVGLHGDMNFRDWYTGMSEKNQTILDAIVAKAGRENVTYELANDVIALRNAATGFYFSVTEEGEFVCDTPTINENCLLELYDWGGELISLRSRYNGKFLSSTEMKFVSDVPYGWNVPERFRITKKDHEYLLRDFRDRWLYINKNGMLSVTDRVKPQYNSLFNVELFSSGFDRVRKAVAEARNAVLVLGNNPLIGARETCDRTTLSLSERQKKLVDLMLKLNANTVLLLVSGYTYEVDERFHSVLHTSHGGPEMGTAIAKVLYGEVSPAGRCPVTWYSSASELGDIKDYNIIRTESTYRYYRGEPLFPFGHGLSYTTFKYSALKLNKTAFAENERCEVLVEVSNIGSRGSDEVVQLYVRSPRFSSAVPIKELKDFRRVYISGEESEIIRLTFDISDLARWDPNKRKYSVFSGVYEIQVGSSSAQILRTADITVSGEDYIGLDIHKTVPASASWDSAGTELLTDENLEEYALMTDEFSGISFENCMLNGEKNIEIVVSNPSTKAALFVTNAANGEVFAKIDVPTTGSLTNFTKITAPIDQKLGKYALKFRPSAVMSFRSFRIF